MKGDSAVNSLADLTALVKSKPGTMSWASSGVGAGPYLSGELFRTKGSLDVVHVPFTGTPPSLNAVIGGHVNYVLADITSLPLVRSGQLKALAVTTPKRSPLLPDVPTFAEAGVPGVEVSNWSSIIVPAGTPADVTAFLNRSIVKALEQPEVKASYEKLGFVPAALDPRGARRVLPLRDAEIRRGHQECRHPAELMRAERCQRVALPLAGEGRESEAESGTGLFCVHGTLASRSHSPATLSRKRERGP